MRKIKNLSKEQHVQFNKIIFDIDLLIEVVKNNEKNLIPGSITFKELDDLEGYASMKLRNDPRIAFTDHIFDQIHNNRNEENPIKYEELEDFFAKLSRNAEHLQTFLKKYKQFVVYDPETELNIPFVNNINRIVAKTIMRNKYFHTQDKKLVMEYIIMGKRIENISIKRNLNKVKLLKNTNESIKPAKKMKLTKSILHKLIKEEYEKLNENTLYNSEETSTNEVYGGSNTSWSDDDDIITLQDILDLTKDIKIVNYPTKKLANIVLNWDNNPDEIERISKVEVSKQYPILIMVDEKNKIQWILDGNHRAQKALRSNVKTIPAKLIKPSNLDTKSKKILLGLTENIKEEYQKLTENTLYNSEETSTKDFIDYLEDFLDKYVPYFEIKRNSINPDGLIYLTISFEKEEDWEGGYIKNSNFIRFSITDNGIIKLVDFYLHKKGKSKQPSNLLQGMRIKPQRASSLPEFIVKMRKYLDKILAYYAVPDRPQSPTDDDGDKKIKKSDDKSGTPEDKDKKSDNHSYHFSGKRGRPEGTEEDKRIFLAKPRSRKIRRLLEKGMSIREIAEIVGCSTSTVMKVKKMIGMK